MDAILNNLPLLARVVDDRLLAALAAFVADLAAAVSAGSRTAPRA